MMDGVPIRKLLVKKFANKTTSKDLRNYFSKYGNVESCCLRRTQGKSNCAFVTFTNMADAVRAMQDESRKRIHNRVLRVMAAAFSLQPDSMEQTLYNTGKESSNELSIHMLNDDCLRRIFLFLPVAERVRIEIVCKRWRDLSQDSWHMLKTLDLSRWTSMWAMWGFSYAPKIYTDLLHKILLKCGRFLTHINLSHPDHNLSQSTLNIIGKLCSNLTSINVTGLRVYPSDIRILANNCRNITNFYLGSSRYICDNELKYFFEQNQKLEYLVINGNNISGDSLLSLPEQTMCTILLNQCFHLQDNHLSMALKRLKNLKYLGINKCISITERTLEVIGQHCKNLRSLDLRNFLPMTDMPYLIHLVDLKNLNIPFYPKVSDGFLADLVKHCQQLTHLNINGCPEVTDAGLAAVARLVRLEQLCVSFIQQITDDGLKNMCGLKKFVCANCKFTDQGMSTLIKSSPQLEILYLFGCRKITNSTLEVAKYACSNRTNNVILHMFVGETAILPIGQERLPPLLQILQGSRSFQGP